MGLIRFFVVAKFVLVVITRARLGSKLIAGAVRDMEDDFRILLEWTSMGATKIGRQRMNPQLFFSFEPTLSVLAFFPLKLIRKGDNYTVCKHPEDGV